MRFSNSRIAAVSIGVIISFGIGVKLWSCFFENDSSIPVNNFERPSDMDRIVEYVSAKYKVPENTTRAIVSTIHVKTERDTFPDPSMVLAVIATESSFRVGVRSHSGATGLMQVMPVHGRPKSFVENISLGIKILKEYRKQVRTDEEALMAYNIGITRFKQGGSNFQYVNRVKRNYDVFNNLNKKLDSANRLS